VTEPTRRCVHCGGEIAENGDVCTVCEMPVSDDASRSGKGAGEPVVSAAAKEIQTEVERRAAKLRTWAEAVGSMPVEVPTLPSWAAASIRFDEDPAPWLELVRDLERIGTRRVSEMISVMERKLRARVARLEAYSMDSHREREEIDQAVHAADIGDVATALDGFRRIDKVIAVKEQQLDQARADLEHMVTLVTDMEALALAPPERGEVLGPRLEALLRHGDLHGLHGELTSIRTRTDAALHEALPPLVSHLGDRLLLERARGNRVDRDVTELARAARAIARNRMEDGMNHLRRIGSTYGGVVGLLGPDRPGAARTANPATGASRTA
jgi:hypothetical protein